MESNFSSPQAPNSKNKLLVIDDDQQALSVVVASLESEGLEIIASTDPQSCLPLIDRHSPGIVLLDVVMPKVGGMELLQQIVARYPAIDVVLFTGNYSAEAAVEAIEKGASDYLEKPIQLNMLRQRITRLVEEERQQNRTSDLEKELLESHRFHGMVGRSSAMEEVFRRIMRIAPHYQTVLISGPTGCGKELVARAIREMSPVVTGPFSIVNCAAIVETLLESELFGHVRGSFTGAVADRVGMFEAAHKGTIFLDEVEELSPAGQAKLLRVLQERQIQRIGEGNSRGVEVRVIAATNRDLRALVAEKKFREDLFYRLAMIEIHVPALTDHPEDIDLLAQYFLAIYSRRFNKNVTRITRACYEALHRYHWPGNVRELENAIGNAIIMTDTNLINIVHLPREITKSTRESTAREQARFEVSCNLTLEEVEAKYTEAVLGLEAGDVAQTAQRLGIPRSTLYQRLKSLRISTGRNKP